jgi:hypothetical protein
MVEIVTPRLPAYCVVKCFSAGCRFEAVMVPTSVDLCRTRLRGKIKLVRIHVLP